MGRHSLADRPEQKSPADRPKVARRAGNFSGRHAVGTPTPVAVDGFLSFIALLDRNEEGGRHLERNIDRSSENNWSLVAVAGILSFVAMMNMSIVNVALPDIGRSMSMTADSALWIVLSYQAVLVSLLLPAGRWLDGVGLRPALLLAIGGFTACSLFAAAAPNLLWLISARVGQGVFAAIMFVLMPVLATRAVRPERRGRAISVTATLGPLGSALGPAIGGILLDTVGWRAVFLVKVPICVLAFLVAFWKAPQGGRLAFPDGPAIMEMVLAGGGVTILLFAAANASSVWSASALIAVPLLALWLRRYGQKIRGVLRTPGIAPVVTAVLAVAVAFAAMNYAVAQHLLVVEGLSASATGFTVLAFAAAMGAAGPIGGQLADRFGARATASVGTAVTAVGLLLLMVLPTPWSPVDVATRLALAGLGMGLHGGPTQIMVLTTAPRSSIATAGASVQLARSLGFTLGPSLAVAVTSTTGAGVTAALGLAVTLAGMGVVLLARTPAIPITHQPQLASRH